MRKLKGLITTFIVTAALAVAASAQMDLTSVDGSRVNVQGQTGKVVILAIGAKWLPLSDKQADFTNVLAKRYAGKNVVVYFVATDSPTPSKNFASDDDLRKFAFANKLSVPVLRDPNGVAVIRGLKVKQVPSFVILDKNGVPAAEPFGGIDPKYDITVPISKLVDRLL